MVKSLIRLYTGQTRFLLFVAFVIAFLISLSFPVVASALDIVSEKSIGYLDVSVALLLTLLAITIYMTRKPRRVKSRKVLIMSYKVLLTIPLILLCIYFIHPDIRWDILLIGLSWRFWLLSLIMDDLISIYMHRKKNYGQDIVYYQ